MEIRRRLDDYDACPSLLRSASPTGNGAGHRMKRILKYDLGIGVHTVNIPAGAEILTARYQHSNYGDGVKLWALVDTDPATRKIPVTYLLIRTGGEVMIPVTYVATIENPDGLIFHLF